MNKLGQMIDDSILVKTYIKFLNLKPVKFFFDNSYVAKLWHESMMYKIVTFHIDKLSPYIPKSHIRFSPVMLGAFMALIILCPRNMWNDILLIPLMLVIGMVFVSHKADTVNGKGFLLVSATMTILVAITAFTVPMAIFRSMFYLGLAIEFFFIVSYGIEKEEQLNNFLKYIYLTVLALCLIGLVENIRTAAAYGVHSTLESPMSLAEAIILLTPFALSYANSLKSRTRRIAYTLVMLFVSFTTIMATNSKAGFIGYSVTVLMYIVIANWRYLPFVILLAPAILTAAVTKLVSVWKNQATHGNIIENVIYVAMDFWRNGIGVGSKRFLSIYSSGLGNAVGKTFLSIPDVEVNLTYAHMLLELGFVLMFAFLWYILRLARSTISAILFRSEGNSRCVYVAGLAALVGISISALFEYTMFKPVNLIIYWGVIGIIAAQTKIGYSQR